MYLEFIILSLALLAGAQKGNECSELSRCDKNQTCSFGYCRCNKGFVKINNSCFKAQAFHGEPCEFDVQCNVDHRLACIEDRNGNKTCQCCRYYEFDEKLQECTYAKNLTEMLSMLQEKWDNIGAIEKEARTVFSGLVAAGLLSIVLGVIFAGGCVIYGCFIPRWKMKFAPEPDYQTMPLCPVSKEPVGVGGQEPHTPGGHASTWEDPSSSQATNANQINSAAEMIV